MRRHQAIKHLQRSAEALQRADWAEANIQAERSIFFDHGIADAFTLQAVALTNLEKPEEAVTAFRKALMLEPTQPRHSYNLAAHLYAKGEMFDARKAASQALQDDPDFELATELVRRIDENREGGSVEFSVPEVAAVLREPVEGAAKHVLPFMAGMERPWTTIGWIFVGVAVLAGIGMWVFQPVQPPLKEAKNAAFVFRSDPGSIITIFLLVMSAVFSLVWMLVDVVDRKSRIVWLVPAVACCTCGMHAIPHALYMLMRRDA